MSDSPIGLIGVGLLGTALAERMLAAGLPVVGFDLQLLQVERLGGLGGKVAATAGDVAAACNCIVLCLPDSSIVAEVVNQLGDRLRAGALLIDATTGDPDQTAAIAQRLAPRGNCYNHAPISG